MPSAATASAVAAIFVHQCERDTSLLLIPRAEIHLVARFGPSARDGLDVHAFAVRQRVHRKPVGAGQRTVTARLRLGSSEVVLGVPVSAIAGRLVALEDLWGAAATRRLCDRLADGRGQLDAAATLASAIAERAATTDGPGARAQFVLAAANKLMSANVNAVAADLGVSERHLRRVFRDAIGMSPKEFARLTRFHRALSAARNDRNKSWANIAAAAGYYDQAHVIAEFRAIAGVTPAAFIGELGESASGTTRMALALDPWCAVKTMPDR